MNDVRHLLEERWKSKVLREAAKSLNFIGLMAATYRAPEFLEFIEELYRGIDRWRRTAPVRRRIFLN